MTKTTKTNITAASDKQLKGENVTAKEKEAKDSLPHIFFVRALKDIYCTENESIEKDTASDLSEITEIPINLDAEQED